MNYGIQKQIDIYGREYDQLTIWGEDMNYVGLDLSTKTGFVKLSPDGEVLEALEIQSKCDTPESMYGLAMLILARLQPADKVVIEGFGFSSQQAIQLGGIGWVTRVALWKEDIQYHVAAPGTVKKFASGKGNMKKDELAVEIYKRWGFEHKSDNVRDAFILAQMARGVHLPLELTKFQQEAIQTVLGSGKKK